MSSPLPPMSSLCTPASNAAEATEEEDACFAEAADNLDLQKQHSFKRSVTKIPPTEECHLLLVATVVSKSATPLEVSMPLSLSLPELLELASSEMPEEEEELLLEELHVQERE